VLTTHIDRDPLRPWHKEILARFGVEDVNALLPVCMSLDGGLTHVDAEGVRKGRISGCARIVVNAAVGGDELARSVMGKVAREVVDLVEPLVSRPPTRSDPGDGTVRASGDTRNGGGIGGGVDGRGESGLVLGETMLVMGGGLSGVPIFRGMVEAGMKERGWRWGEVRVVDDPAGDGVRALMNG